MARPPMFVPIRADLALAGNLSAARKNRLDQGRIQATDRQIDRLVYEPYGLTDQEITMVEEATKGKDE
jgi:hypothetical protein